MKIYEIISEDRVDETNPLVKGLGIAGDWLVTSWSKKKLIDMLSKNDNLINKWHNGIPPTSTEIERLYGREAAELIRADDTILSKAAAKKVDKAAAASRNATTAAREHDIILARIANRQVDPTISNSVSNALSRAGGRWGSLGSLTDMSTKLKWALVTYGFYSYVKQYYDEVAYLDENLEPKGPLNQKDYDQYRQRAMSYMMAQIAAGLVGNAAIMTAGGFLKAFCILPGMGPIRTLIGGLTGTSQVALMAILATPTGRKYLAEYLSFSNIDPWLGGSGITALAWIRKQIKDLSRKDGDKTDDTSDTDTSTDTEEPADDTTAADKPAAKPAAEKPAAADNTDKKQPPAAASVKDKEDDSFLGTIGNSVPGGRRGGLAGRGLD
jgi:hypothetical protein